MRFYDLPLKCMNHDTEAQIGSSIERVTQVDLLVNEVSWGNALCVKVELNLTKALVVVVQ